MGKLLLMLLTVGALFLPRSAFASDRIHPVEGRDYQVLSPTTEGQRRIRIASDVNLNTVRLAEQLGTTPFDLKRDNPYGTLALCKDAQGRFSLSVGVNSVQTRTVETIWKDCPADHRYTYVLPGATLVVTGLKHGTYDGEQAALRALQACPDDATVECVRAALVPLGKSFVLPQPTPSVAVTGAPGVPVPVASSDDASRSLSWSWLFALMFALLSAFSLISWRQDKIAAGIKLEAVRKKFDDDYADAERGFLQQRIALRKELTDATETAKKRATLLEEQAAELERLRQEKQAWHVAVLGALARMDYHPAADASPSDLFHLYQAQQAERFRVLETAKSEAQQRAEQAEAELRDITASRNLLKTAVDREQHESSQALLGCQSLFKRLEQMSLRAGEIDGAVEARSANLDLLRKKQDKFAPDDPRRQLCDQEIACAEPPLRDLLQEQADIAEHLPELRREFDDLHEQLTGVRFTESAVYTRAQEFQRQAIAELERVQTLRELARDHEVHLAQWEREFQERVAEHTHAEAERLDKLVEREAAIAERDARSLVRESKAVMLSGDLLRALGLSPDISFEKYEALRGPSGSLLLATQKLHEATERTEAMSAQLDIAIAEREAALQERDEARADLEQTQQLVDHPTLVPAPKTTQGLGSGVFASQPEHGKKAQVSLPGMMGPPSPHTLPRYDPSFDGPSPVTIVSGSEPTNGTAKAHTDHSVGQELELDSNTLTDNQTVGHEAKI